MSKRSTLNLSLDFERKIKITVSLSRSCANGGAKLVRDAVIQLGNRVPIQIMTPLAQHACLEIGQFICVAANLQDFKPASIHRVIAERKCHQIATTGI
jgi:hypothetical protein